MNKIELLDLINNTIVEDDKDKAVELICRYINNEEYKDIILMLIDAFQLYGYSKEFDNFEKNFLYEQFDYKYSSYQGKIIKHLNSGQLSLLNSIEKENKLFISAPTSFGKTTLVIEYIYNNVEYINNVIFILPTKSLIEELYIKFLKLNKDLKFEEKYNILLNTIYSAGRTIRILTPEKFLNYYEYNKLDNIDLVVMDETYKIENDGKNNNESVVDNRSLKFRKVLELISDSNSKVIALSPYTYQKDESMKKYMAKYEVVDIDRKTKYVYHEYINLSKADSFAKYFNCEKPLRREYDSIKEKATMILEKLKEKRNIIYISDISKGLDIINKINDKNICFLGNINDENILSRFNIFLNHLENTYNLDDGEEWYVTSSLRKGIGIYVSTMPRYVKKEIIELFDKGAINCLFVTTAFIEGVNSTAENIILTSGYTGRNISLNDMSLLNISGRAGRFGNKYVGNVFFIDDVVYDRVKSVSKDGVIIKNPNYEKSRIIKNRNDYEIEMIDDEFLTINEINRKREIEDRIKEIGIDVEILKNTTISAPNEWKIMIYKYIDENKEKIEEYKNYIINVSSPENEKVVEAMNNIFIILKNSGIEFKNDYSNVNAFTPKGTFIWGELYKYHIDGNIKRIINNTRARVLNLKRYRKNPNLKIWVDKFFYSDGRLNYNHIYGETFRFIANIIEYKIPYYIYLFTSVYIFYVYRNNTEQKLEINVEDLINNIENLGVEKEYIKYYEYGFSKEMIEKIKKVDMEISIENIDMFEEFDDYEKIMLKEYIELTK